MCVSNHLIHSVPGTANLFGSSLSSLANFEVELDAISLRDSLILNVSTFWRRRIGEGPNSIAKTLQFPGCHLNCKAANAPIAKQIYLDFFFLYNLASDNCSPA